MEHVAVELVHRGYPQAAAKVVSAARTIRWVTADKESDLNEVQIAWLVERNKKLLEEKRRLYRIREVLNG